jgi:hypothetical protein
MSYIKNNKITLTFSDEIKFSFSHEQLMLIPYFNNAKIENEMYISRTSEGFKYVHMFATMNEQNIDIPDKNICLLNQCEYFGYDKLKHIIDDNNDQKNYSDEFINDESFVILIFKQHIIYGSSTYLIKISDVKRIPYFKNKNLSPGSHFYINDTSYGFDVIYEFITTGNVSLYDVDIKEIMKYKYCAHVVKQCEYFKCDELKFKYIKKFKEKHKNLPNMFGPEYGLC